MKTATRLTSIVLTITCLMTFSWGADRPNIVWINCEDLDDTLGCYGDAYATTPHLDRLAKESVLYRNAFANAPICAPARNCLITGMYPTSLGGQHLRCEIELPSTVKPFPAHLKHSGYFVTNQSKTDYNFSAEGIYDYWKNDLKPWRKRQDSKQPFFSFFVIGTTHEGRGNFRDRYESAVKGLSPDKRHDPNKATVPPYFPDTPKMRELWARYYDLVAVMDEQVGEILAGLKKDGLWDNTIVWFFSDHGHGLPRHKRWLLDSGLRVPFMVRIPEKYRHLAAGHRAGSETKELVSFVDFAPTVLNLAGIEPPEIMQGQTFLGDNVSSPRRFIFGARDRADDMFEVSRAVHDGRYLYVRHFFHHLPYLQGGKIFGNQKESLAEWRRARDAGELNECSERLFAKHKPVEELYDLQNDPYEIHNLAAAPEQADRLRALGRELKSWILNHRDTGFLTESEYTRRARNAGLTVYEMVQRRDLYDLPAVYRAALGEIPDSEAVDNGVLYWQIINRGPVTTTEESLRDLVEHANPSIAVAASEWACLSGYPDLGLPVLENHIGSHDKRLALEAARALFQIRSLAKPSVRRIEQVRKSLESRDPTSKRRYRDFNYASFIGWALEAALINCEAAKPEDFD